MNVAIGFDDFVRAKSRGLLRTAWLLTGNWAAAEDLVQTALAATWSQWDVHRPDAPEAYVRRVMVTTFLRWNRRRWTGEISTAFLPEHPYSVDAIAGGDLRRSLLAALRTLPPRQRAVIALRYFADLTEADTAAALGCSVGAVKSHASKALSRLRSTTELAGLNEGVPE